MKNCHILNIIISIFKNFLRHSSKRKKLMVRTILTIISLIVPLNIYAGNTPSPKGAKAYFIDLKDGDTAESPLLVRFGLTEQMGVAPAMADWPDTGHFHLIIDAKTPDPKKPISRNHLHLHLGQTEIEIELKKGKHTLQILMGDYSHIPHDPPVMSDRITINIK